MKVFRQIYSLLTSAERKQAIILLALTVVGMLLETLGVGLVIPAIAVLVEADLAAAYPAARPWLESLGSPTRDQILVAGMLGLVILYAVKGLFLAFLYWRQMKFAFGIQASLSERLFAVYLKQPYTFHLQRNSAQLILNVVNEVRLFTFTAMLPLILLVTEGLVLLGIAALLVAVEPVGSIMIVVLLGGAAWSFDRVLRTKIDRAAVKRQFHDGLRMQHLQQGLGGAKEVKLLGRESEFLAQYHFHDVQTAEGLQVQQTLQQLPRLWLELCGAAALAIVVLSAWVQGEGASAILATLGLFSAAALRLMPSMTRLMGARQYLRSSVPVVQVLCDELGLPVVPSASSSSQAAVFETDLKLVNVSYTYPNAQGPALSGVSIAIKKNECIGFIGHSGSGKSTLMDLLLGLLSPEAGNILVDDKDIVSDLRGWQNQIGYVPQTIFLTDDTLRRNVAFGIPEAQIDDVAVRRALRAAQLEAFVDSLEHGIGTFVGERGVRLSGGQRQRIGIARALYHDPAVLVLDEATSSLDAETEHGVMQAVLALQGAKTILVVAHRLSTVERCDRLYRLDRGRVVQEGAPQTILFPSRSPKD